MRSLMIAALVANLAGCSSIEIKPPLCPGTREYDVQVCRGEKHRVGTNFPMEALQRANKCEKCIEIEKNCYHGLPPQCRTKWRFEQ
jgi:hypothetical protein